MIKAVIFDCFGVLTGDKWKEFVASLPKEQREPARELNQALNTKQLDFREFLRRIHELTSHSPENVANVINAEMYKDKTLLAYIATLKPRYKIGLLSNVSTEWIRTDLLTPEELGFFDDQVLSFEVGIVKPDSGIYKLAAQRLKVKMSECVFIDDGVSNCEGARKVGMQAILYQNFEQMRHDLEKLLSNPNE